LGFRANGADPEVATSALILQAGPRMPSPHGSKIDLVSEDSRMGA
jgi:hypothetical protein